MKLSRRNLASALAGSSLVFGVRGGAGVSQQAEAPVAWRPLFFSEHEAETFACLAEVILPKTDTPGAREALVHQHADLILRDSPLEVQTRFLEGLWWMDSYSRRTKLKPFRVLSEAEQSSLAGELFESTQVEDAPGRSFLVEAKHLTSRIYYSTEEGVRELNKEGRVPGSYYERQCSGGA